MPLEPPFKKGKTKSEKQENRIGNLPGGHKQVNSGRFPWWPRDAVLGPFLVEARTTDAGTYRLSAKEFTTLNSQAQVRRMLPAMQIDVGDHELVAIRLSDLVAFLEEISELRGSGSD